MSKEIELKLDVDPDTIPQLLGSHLFPGEPAVVQQRSIYFDTPAHDLNAEGFTLRIRSVGEKRTQTVKAIRASTAGLFARPEWEFAVKSDEPVIDHTSPLKAEFGEVLNDLVRQFEVVVERRIWTVNEESAKIEVALDTGSVEAAGRQTRLCELELELKQGDPAALFTLANKIAAAVPVRLGVVSKAERGYRLLGKAVTVVKAEPLELERTMGTTQSFQIIAHACLRQFRLNETILLDLRNAESLHQARVALRRLRSAFSVYKPVLAGPEAEALQSELKWLAGMLGDARNIDVLLPKAHDEDTRARLKAARQDAYEDVVEALQSKRTGDLMLNLCQWLARGEFLGSAAAEDDPPTKTADFATSALEKLRKKLKKHGKSFSGADDEHRHEVRKDAKKLRYASDFFSSIFDGKKEERRYKRFIKLMETLQDQLGFLNDLATQPDVTEKIGIDSRDIAQDHPEKAVLLDDAEAALADLLEAKRFW